MKKKVGNGKKMRRCRGGGGFIYSGKQLVAFIVAVVLTSNLVNVNASVSDNLNTAVISVLTKISDFISGINSGTSGIKENTGGIKDNTKTIGDNTGDLASTLASMDAKLGSLVNNSTSSAGNKDITFIANSNGKVIDSGSLSATAWYTGDYYQISGISKTFTSTTGGCVYMKPIGSRTIWVSVDGKPRVPYTMFDRVSEDNRVTSITGSASQVYGTNNYTYNFTNSNSSSATVKINYGSTVTVSADANSYVQEGTTQGFYYVCYAY